MEVYYHITEDLFDDLFRIPFLCIWGCSAHTDCIVAEDQKVAETFLKQVDR